MDTTPDSLQDRFSSLESQPSFLPANDVVAIAEDAQTNQSEKSDAPVQAKTVEQSEAATNSMNEMESNAHTSPDNQPQKTGPADTPAQRPASEDNKSTTPQSASSKGTKATTAKDPKEKTLKNQKEADNAKKPKQDQNANVAANAKQSKENTLTIYFHAVLSKDFGFDPEEDLIFIRAGSCIGKWEDNAAELFVTRDLGEHGFLVEGSLPASKKEAVSASIPYKYVVYRNKKETYEYEYIYKMDSTHTTNRCLFVKEHLINDDGDWHQYDDIICVKPSKNVLERLVEKFWPEKRKDLIQGREIAGNIMLETIFDLLRSWTETNLRSFLVQLNQFIQVYGDPFVFEEKQKKWYSLKYGEEDVSLQYFFTKYRGYGQVMATSADLFLFLYYILGEKNNRSHLMEVDALLIRSCLYLMSLDELIECSTELKAELLDMLHVFLNKVPQDITGGNMQDADKNKALMNCILQMWNNVISIHFKDEDCTKEWRQTLTMDFEGKYRQGYPLDQIEFYCTKIEDLSDSHPHVAASIERCALEAVTYLCQDLDLHYSYRFKINSKFGKLISAIIQKSWPRDKKYRAFEIAKKNFYHNI
uniref:CBM20 domain-containing protein n=1 Tax=Maylandia zebra TaxID=106582 RepID=A0A3P9C4G5_9CICH